MKTMLMMLMVLMVVESVRPPGTAGSAGRAGHGRGRWRRDTAPPTSTSSLTELTMGSDVRVSQQTLSLSFELKASVITQSG